MQVLVASNVHRRAKSPSTMARQHSFISRLLFKLGVQLTLECVPARHGPLEQRTNSLDVLLHLCAADSVWTLCNAACTAAEHNVQRTCCWPQRQADENSNTCHCKPHLTKSVSARNKSPAYLGSKVHRVLTEPGLPDLSNFQISANATGPVLCAHPGDLPVQVTRVCKRPYTWIATTLWCETLS